MTDEQLTRLRAEIAALEAQIAALKDVAGAAEALHPLLAERRRALAALERGEPLPPGLTQIGRLNIGPGASLHNTGDIVAGDKYSAQGPLIVGDIKSGRDTNIAGRDQTIVNRADPASADSEPPDPAELLTPPPLRLVLTDPGGQQRERLAVGDEALLRLEWADTPVELPALSLVAAGDGVSWLSGTRVELRAGQRPRLPQWALVAEQPGMLQLQVLVLAGTTLLQALALDVPVAAAGDAALLSGVASAAPAPAPRAAVAYDLATAPAVSPGDDALTLFFARGSETLRLVVIERGQSWEVALPLSDYDLAALTQRAHNGLREVVLDRSNRALLDGVTIPPDVADNVMRRLALHGAALWDGLFNPPGASSDLHVLREHLRARSRTTSLHITVVGHRVALPWALLYDGDPRTTVQADRFWGLRHHLVLQPLHGRRRAQGGDPQLGPATGLPALLAFNLDVERQVRVPLCAPQRAAFAALGMQATEVTSGAALRDTLAAGTAAAVVYLYSHMQTPLQQARGPTVDMDEITIDLGGGEPALTLAELRRAAPVALKPRLRGGPLVVLNACHSSALTPLSFGGMVPYLLDLGARAVIGTAVETPIHFAAAFGPALLTTLMRERLTAGAALRATRVQFLEQQRNPLGLLYHLYGNGELRVTEA